MTHGKVVRSSINASPRKNCSKIYIDGLAQVLTHWSYVFLALTHRYVVPPQELQEYKFNQSCGAHNSRGFTTWQRVFCPLPAGIYQLVIDGSRGTTAETTSLALDDITIWPCKRYCELYTTETFAIIV